ncbi:MAG: hypothetical protein IPK12_23720 [Gemmatimonadetes bacterium]|nr:hypothetical protein [Gemmatimonadota bacterium]
MPVPEQYPSRPAARSRVSRRKPSSGSAASRPATPRPWPPAWPARWSACHPRPRCATSSTPSRELGFPGWRELKAALERAAAGNLAALAPYEEKADALLQAYRLGTPEAMERHYRLTWHRRAWPTMRRYVRLDLGLPDLDPDNAIDITLDDARTLIAREHAYRSWDALVADVCHRAPGGPYTARPTEVLWPGAPRGANPDRHTRDWGATLERLRDPAVEGLDAHGQVTDALMATLTGCGHLTTLSLDGCKALTDAGLAHLAALPNLRHLGLGGTAITDAGLGVLASLTQLETLNLGGTRVTDAGLGVLSRLTKLRAVDLMWTRTGDGALRALAGHADLADFKSGMGVTDAGLGLLREFPAWRTWREPAPAIELLNFDTKPNHLFLRGRFSDAGLRQLHGLDGLFALNLDQADNGIGPAGLALLAELPRLAWLAYPAGDTTMGVIAALPALRFLSCQDTEATDDGWVALACSRTLAGIWGRETMHFGDRGLRAFAAMPALASMALGLGAVSDATLALLPEFPALRHLMPMGVPDAGYRHVGRCTGLEELTLMYCRHTGDEATSHLTALPALRKYFVSYNHITDRTCELLATIPSLEDVTLSAVAGITDAGVAKLAALPRLRRVDVSGQGVSPAVVQAFPPGVEVRVSP